LDEELKTAHKFNEQKGMTGKDFYYDYMKSTGQYLLRTPEGRLALYTAFNV
jgi:hypothetical protein